MISWITYADPGIFLQGGGGGVVVQAGCPENSPDNIFVFLFYYFSKDPKGVQLFTGGGGGSKCLFL